MLDPTLNTFVGNLAPAALDRTEVGRRRDEVSTRLNLSTLTVRRMFESGSWSHGTGVAAHSDVDYMAIASGVRPMRPSTALATAKAALAGSSWKISAVAVSSPIVAVTYHVSPNFEVAPAWFKETIRGHSVYWIAGRSDEWVVSAPGAHLAYVSSQNDRLNKKVKPLIRLMKAWKYSVGAPVSSFYLEMRTAEYASRETSIVYDIDLRRMFDRIIDYQARDMNDPEGIVGRIPACASEDKRRTTLRLAQEALTNLEIAQAARDANNKTANWIAMSKVFGDKYPWPTW
ncbi:hypothetical protein Cci01nite_83800 [Catellatospora citrea]|uniref:Nucleotidyltransferase-like protein n=2 Tax=Catellatospora citrea TaxID=53366 RepID=A0A8J3P4E4_9ACTN|nr:hypothetical protein [Catellatospora citrea]RKE09689.1 hypothetical protein C8E86_4579 [Catellatospora citrea]GIG03287.1 hypothetical protein Cci01nite_83800 [Catellatospora citrea]